MVARTVLVLFLVSASYAQARQEREPTTFFTWIWPVEKPQPRLQAQPQQQKTGAAAHEAARFRAARHAIEEQEKEQRALRELYVRRAAAQPPVEPEKDKYRKYLADKREQEEAKYDPIVAEVRAEYMRDDPDEFKKWKASQAPAQERQPRASQPAQKELDLQKFLDGNGQTKAKSKAKAQVEEE